MKVDAIVKAMSKYLTDKGYIKMNPYLYMKNIKTDVVTGDIILVDFKFRIIRVMKVEDKFLCFSKKPTVKLTECHYDTLAEFKKYIKANENAEVEFLKKDIDWKKKGK